MAAFDAKKLSPLDWGVGGAGALAFIALFLPWYGASYLSFSATVSGWSTSYGWLGALLIVAAGAYLVLQRSGVSLGNLKVGPAVIVLGAASLGALIVILRWLTLPSGGAGVYGYSYGPRIGIYITLVAGVVQAGCAFALFRASGESLPWAAQGSARVGGTPGPGSAFGTPAPGPDFGIPTPGSTYGVEQSLPGGEPQDSPPDDGASPPTN